MLIFGHRGIRKKNDKDAPYQNTLEAIEQGFAEFADGVEIDVILSKDKGIFLIHDEELEKHSLSNGKISQLNANELSKIKVGNFNNKPGYKIPELGELLDLLTAKYPDKHLNIELKGPATALPVVKMVNEKGFNKNNLSLSSFDHAQLHDVYKEDKSINISPLIDRHLIHVKNTTFPAMVEPFLKYESLYSLNLEDELVGEEKQYDFGKKIYVWSLSDKPPTMQQVEFLLRNKADCLMTDFPLIARENMDYILRGC